MDFNLVKENIECEQLLGENFVDTPIRGEYVIPDSNPDVIEVLMLDSKPHISSKEVMENKISIEGYIEHNIIYLAKEEEYNVVYNASYTTKFSNDVQIQGAENNMSCDAKCLIEDMSCRIVNERKIAIEGIIKLKGEVYKNYNFEIVKDLEDIKDVQMLRNPISIDKMMGTATGELIAKSNIKISNDKPEVGNILKYDVNVHKKQINILDNNIHIEAFAKIELIYRGKDTRDIYYLEDDVFINKDVELKGASSFMDNYTDFVVDAISINLKEDDLGERRIIDIEVLIKSNTKVMYKKEIEVIEDMYCPSMMIDIKKQDYELNVMQGHSKLEHIIKSNIELSSKVPYIREIIMTDAKVYVTDKKIVEDKVIVEGLLSAEVMYKTVDNDKYIYTVKDDIPFTCPLDIPGCKIDMQCMAKVKLENIESVIEANTIGVKAIVEVYTRVNYITHKEFLVNVEEIEEEIPKKKSSITIYVVQQGDTLWKIAKRYYTTVDNLVLINDIENPDIIKPGQKLIIPGKAII